MSLILATSYINIPKICADCLTNLDKSHSTEADGAKEEQAFPAFQAPESTSKIAEDEPTEIRQFINTRSYFSAEFEGFKIEFLRIISKISYFKNNFTTEIEKNIKYNLDNREHEKWQSEPLTDPVV